MGMMPFAQNQMSAPDRENVGDSPPTRIRAGSVRFTERLAGKACSLAARTPADRMHLSRGAGAHTDAPPVSGEQRPLLLPALLLAQAASRGRVIAVRCPEAPSRRYSVPRTQAKILGVFLQLRGTGWRVRGPLSRARSPAAPGGARRNVQAVPPQDGCPLCLPAVESAQDLATGKRRRRRRSTAPGRGGVVPCRRPAGARVGVQTPPGGSNPPVASIRNWRNPLGEWIPGAFLFGVGNVPVAQVSPRSQKGRTCSGQERR